MNIGLIDVDGHNFPNIPLMKISAYHKSKGDDVEMVVPIECKEYDKVYMSKVFSFTEDYPYFINAKEIHRGGTGYCISMENGREVFDKIKDVELNEEIEHQYPDYSLYGITDTAYGFLTRGCPRGCSFCHVAAKEGRCSRKVADLNEFWSGQRNIVLLDPNILACKEWKSLLKQLADSKSSVDFSQGIDIRVMTEEKAEMFSDIKISAKKGIHFAWDRIEDKEKIIPNFLEFKKHTKIGDHNLQVYVLTGDRSHDLTEDDLFRVEWLKDNGFAPYVMVYDKEHASRELRQFQRYVNNRIIFWSTDWKGYKNGNH